MKKYLLLFLGIFAYQLSNAQLSKTDIKEQMQTENKDTVAWLYGFNLNIGFNEGFLHNWAAGGEIASMNVNGLFSGYVNHLAHREVLAINLDMTYGLYYAYSNSFIPRKTDDRIDFTTKYGYRLDTSKNFYLTGLFNFKSQFTKGYDYTLSNWDTMSTSKFFAPAYFTLGLGVEYRKGSNLSIFLSPAAARLTVVDKEYTLRSPEGAFGVAYGKTTNTEFGAYFSARYVWQISKNVTFKTRLDLYSNYLAKDTKDSLGAVIKRDNPGNIDVLFDNLLSCKVAKRIALNIGATAIYDNDIPYVKNTTDENGNVVPKNEPGKDIGWLQLKQFLTLGFTYKL